MHYELLCKNPEKSLTQRLLAIRNIESHSDHFLKPSFSHYRKDPFLLSDMKKATQRIQQAITKKENIMIFGDYDVDGITSSYCIYDFIKRHYQHHNISIMFPHRRNDGYGIKKKHINIMKEKNIGLIITVDNGITSIEEADHAKEQDIDMIITDHHHNLEIIPQAHAIINPHTSPDYPFKGICGAVVVFKLINALLKESEASKETKASFFHYYLPIATIATVADCVPLIDENRVIVKKGLECINRGQMPLSLKSFIEHLNIKGRINSMHIGFQLGPRINAGGRIKTPYDSLYTLLYEGEKQKPYLEAIEDINTQRKKLQEEAIKDAKEKIDHNKKILIAYNPHYHEGVVGIVAGRITEQHHKPSLIMYINEEKGTASGSLRCPPYFSVIKMLQEQSISGLLEKYGGHQQAGGLTVGLDNIDTLIERLEKYCEDSITEKSLIKKRKVDTRLQSKDIHSDIINDINLLAPFGIGNEEPSFLIENAYVDDLKYMGKEQSHIKLSISFKNHECHAIIRNKGEKEKELKIGMELNIIGKIQADTYNGGRYIQVKDREQNS